MSNVLLLLLQASNTGSILSLAPQVYAIVDEGGSGGSSGGSGKDDLMGRIANAFRIGEQVVVLNEAYKSDKQNGQLRNDLETAVNEFFGFILDHFPHPNPDNQQRDANVVEESIYATHARSSEDIAHLAEDIIPVGIARAVYLKMRRGYIENTHPIRTAKKFEEFARVYGGALLGPRN